jgi:hypothetical protein
MTEMTFLNSLGLIFPHVRQGFKKPSVHTIVELTKQCETAQSCCKTTCRMKQNKKIILE